jgi:hypothetical protein
MLNKDEKIKTLEAIQCLSDAARHLAEMYRYTLAAPSALSPDEKKLNREDVLVSLKSSRSLAQMANKNLAAVLLGVRERG